MKSILTGLERLKEKMNEKGEGVFLKLEDKEKVTIRFLQELDESARHYDSDRGLAIAVNEHVNPDDFAQSFLCTMEEEGRCVGCERVPINSKWRAKGRLLVNVLVRGGKSGEDKIKVLGMSMSTKGLAPTLIMYAEEDTTICDKDFILKREGLKLKTTYQLMPREVKPLTKTEEKSELIDLARAYRNPNYDEQLELLGESGSDW